MHYIRIPYRFVLFMVLYKKKQLIHLYDNKLYVLLLLFLSYFITLSHVPYYFL